MGFCQNTWIITIKIILYVQRSHCGGTMLLLAKKNENPLQKQVSIFWRDYRHLEMIAADLIELHGNDKNWTNLLK